LNSNNNVSATNPASNSISSGSKANNDRLESPRSVGVLSTERKGNVNDGVDSRPMSIDNNVSQPPLEEKGTLYSDQPQQIMNSPRACYTCNEVGHIARDCPHSRNTSPQNRKRGGTTNLGASNLDHHRYQDDNNRPNYMRNNRQQLQHNSGGGGGGGNAGTVNLNLDRYSNPDYRNTSQQHGRDFKDRHDNFNRYTPYDRSQHQQPQPQRDRTWNDDRRAGGRFRSNTQGYRPLTPPFTTPLSPTNWHPSPISPAMANHLASLYLEHYAKEGGMRGGYRRPGNFRTFNHYSPPRNQNPRRDMGRELYNPTEQRNEPYINAAKNDAYPLNTRVEREYENRDYNRGANDNRDYNREYRDNNREFRDREHYEPKPENREFNRTDYKDNRDYNRTGAIASVDNRTEIRDPAKDNRQDNREFNRDNFNRNRYNNNQNNRGRNNNNRR